MPELLRLLLLTGLAGLAIPAGALLGAAERIRPRWLEREFRHFVIAFGGGLLLAAVSLVLVPEGIEGLSPGSVGASMSAGGLSFLWIDRLLARRRTAASQLLAMLADFFPEALALGAILSSGSSAAALLTVLIALQNLPEGFNAFREIRSTGRVSDRKILLGFLALVPLGPAAGLAGMYWLSRAPLAVDAVMLFSAAGILYLTFQDIAPQVRLQRHWLPPLGAVLGFLAGLLGQMLLEG